ncbi:MAG: response regulator [Dehalococcoidales bacterium]|nr:response regulator [Dehalococcoidales bacterium]
MKPILIVDDEISIREALKDWLTDNGYDVKTAESGEDALEAIEEQDFGMAILDLKLPGKNGLEVFKEARTKHPRLNGIFITAYPSIDTAVEAMKDGAVDYLTKPLDLNELEKLIREKLGPMQIEVRKQEAKVETVIETKEDTTPAIEENIAIAPEDIPEHIRLGQVYYDNAKYNDAIKEFSSVIAVSPENIDARIGLRKAQESNYNESIGGVAQLKTGGKITECIWMKMGMVDFRICTSEHNCTSCQFDQEMQQKMAGGESVELDNTMEKLKELPGTRRSCRYAIKGDVSSRICSRLFQCKVCEFNQGMEDALRQKLQKLAARREALARREEKNNTQTN